MNGHFFIKVILDCTHFSDVGRFEYDNAYEQRHRGRVGWALPTIIS
jgi:hypothetical protein